MMLFRLVLKRILLVLSKWAIRKHHIEMIVVSGWFGTEIARELLYYSLSGKYRVRRMTRNFWWDFSLPLNILGYEDKRRNPISWLFLIYRCFFYLLLGRANPHKLILNLNNADINTNKFWSEIVQPDLLFMTSYRPDLELLNQLIANTIKKNGKIVLPEQAYNEISGTKNDFTGGNFITFGPKNWAVHLKHLLIRIKKEKVEISRDIFPGILPQTLTGIIMISHELGLNIKDAAFDLLKYEPQQRHLDKLKNEFITLGK
jgi:hypothetical protein